MTTHLRVAYLLCCLLLTGAALSGCADDGNNDNPNADAGTDGSVQDVVEEDTTTDSGDDTTDDADVSADDADGSSEDSGTEGVPTGETCPSDCQPPVPTDGVMVCEGCEGDLCAFNQLGETFCSRECSTNEDCQVVGEGASCNAGGRCGPPD